MNLVDRGTDFADFWRERHLCTLTTHRPDGSLHVVPVGVALDHERRCAWVISSGGSRKVRNLLAGGGALAACQVDGARWLTLEQARTVMLPTQLPLLDRLAELLG